MSYSEGQSVIDSKLRRGKVRGGVRLLDYDNKFHHVVEFFSGGWDWISPDDLRPDGPGVSDPVQSPSHYDLPGGIQVIDLIRGESFLRGNALKYIFRAPHKGKELEDMRKAAEYVNWEIERLENEQSS